MDPEDLDPRRSSIELVRRAQAGDLGAFDELFASHYEQVLAIVRRRMGRGLRLGLESHDILQEAMVEAIRSFSQFEARDEAALLAWFARIVENRIRNTAEHQRAAKRDRRSEVVLDHLRTAGAPRSPAPEPADPATRPFESLARKERAQIVADCLTELDERRRRVIELRNRRRLSWDAIAAELDAASPQAARMLFSRAMIELGEKVKRRLGEG